MRKPEYMREREWVAHRRLWGRLRGTESARLRVREGSLDVLRVALRGLPARICADGPLRRRDVPLHRRVASLRMNSEIIINFPIQIKKTIRSMNDLMRRGISRRWEPTC